MKYVWLSASLTISRPDYILHLETLDQDLSRLLTQVKLDQHRNMFPHTHTQVGGSSDQLRSQFVSQLSQHQLGQLVETYSLDFELFGYDKHSWW